MTLAAGTRFWIDHGRLWGTVEGPGPRRNGLLWVRWDSGVRELIHYSELKARREKKS